MDNNTKILFVLAMAVIIGNPVFFLFNKSSDESVRRKYPEEQIINIPKKALMIFYLCPLAFLFSLGLIAYSIFVLDIDMLLPILLILLIPATVINSGILAYVFKRWQIIVDEDTLIITPYLGKAREVCYADIDEVRLGINDTRQEKSEALEIYCKGKKVVSVPSGMQNYDHFHEKLKTKGLISSTI
ncbi:MAG: hypothetical protein LBD23_19020 [Oscillospiraceae bacterium]|jgi:hypothetical protein|nr:hypothetical protein [Oscillospiraceae bacterium]